MRMVKLRWCPAAGPAAPNREQGTLAQGHKLLLATARVQAEHDCMSRNGMTSWAGWCRPPGLRSWATMVGQCWLGLPSCDWLRLGVRTGVCEREEMRTGPDGFLRWTRLVLALCPPN